MARDFFYDTQTRLSNRLSFLADDEEVKAFLHASEKKYKESNGLLPLYKHRDEYENFSFDMLKRINRRDLEKYREEYRVYKQNQKIKLQAARVFETVILPKVKKFTRQKIWGYHGLEHSELVALRAIDCAVACNRKTMPELMPVLAAAALHDCARTNDEYNNNHGPDAARMPEVRAFLQDRELGLSPQQQRQVLDAVARHTVASPKDNNVDYVTECLCDADRIRISWERVHDSKYFFTEYGEKLGAATAYQAYDYLCGWDTLLSNPPAELNETPVRLVTGQLKNKYRIAYKNHVGCKRLIFIDPAARMGYCQNKGNVK